MVPLILNCAGCQVENGLEGGWWVVSVQQRQKQGGRCGGSYSHQAGDTPPPRPAVAAGVVAARLVGFWGCVEG